MRLPISGAYTADWPDVSKRCRNDAGWRCVRCHHPFDVDGKPLPCDDACDTTRGRRLAGSHNTGPGLNYGVHHLDGNKGNNRWHNLLALCNSCHLSVQSSVIPGRPWLLPHADWFRVYVAGYYAFAAGIEITRLDAVQQLDRWLALGQPWLGETEGVR